MAGPGTHTMILLLALSALGFSGSATVQPPAPRTAQCTPPDASLSKRLLGVHNRYRAEFGATPLQWNPALAASACAYGPQLARLGKLEHSPRQGRPGQSENLWMGSRGRYKLEAMVEYWADERLDFRPGIFPNVSVTPNWLDVSHYTTMIWPQTTHVGCHLEQTRSHDMLICRYSPKGNQDGRFLGIRKP